MKLRRGTNPQKSASARAAQNDVIGSWYNKIIDEAASFETGKESLSSLTSFVEQLVTYFETEESITREHVLDFITNVINRRGEEGFPALGPVEVSSGIFTKTTHENPILTAFMRLAKKHTDIEVMAALKHEQATQDAREMLYVFVDQSSTDEVDNEMRALMTSRIPRVRNFAAHSGMVSVRVLDELMEHPVDEVRNLAMNVLRVRLANEHENRDLLTYTLSAHCNSDHPNTREFVSQLAPPELTAEMAKEDGDAVFASEHLVRAKSRWVLAASLPTTASDRGL